MREMKNQNTLKERLIGALFLIAREIATAQSSPQRGGYHVGGIHEGKRNDASAILRKEGG
jgi:hypothetical protein